MFERILVALDASSHSNQVFNTALSLAKLANARLLLTHVLLHKLDDSEIRGLVDRDPALTGYDESVSPKQDETEGLEMLRTFHRLAASAKIGADLAQPLANPAHMICNLAYDWGADLIVMGHRGLIATDEAIFSSVSTYVMHHATCPVLVVQCSINQHLGLQLPSPLSHMAT